MTDKEIEDFIKDINTDGDDFISKSELKRHCNKKGFNLSDMTNFLDLDGDGDISIDELKEVLKQC